MHNSVVQAIATSKNYFVTGIKSAPPSFQLNIWDKLIPQVLLTLNLLQPSRISPRLSVYTQVNGSFDYKTTLFFPLVINILAHILPKDLISWSIHAVKGIYIGPTMEQYQYNNIWILSTNKICIANTVK